MIKHLYNIRGILLALYLLATAILNHASPLHIHIYEHGHQTISSTNQDHVYGAHFAISQSEEHEHSHNYISVEVDSSMMNKILKAIFIFTLLLLIVSSAFIYRGSLRYFRLSDFLHYLKRSSSPPDVRGPPVLTF